MIAPTARPHTDVALSLIAIAADVRDGRFIVSMSGLNIVKLRNAFIIEVLHISKLSFRQSTELLVCPLE